MYPSDQQMQTTKYGLYDMIWLKRKEFILILYFTPSDMNFQTILMSQVILAKILSRKSWSLRTILIVNEL